MSNDRIWAPWRLGYIKGQSQLPDPKPARWLEGADESCFFCRNIAEHEHARSSGAEAVVLTAIDRDNLVVWHGQETVVLLNRYPYNNGHLLVAPRRHVARLDGLTPAEQRELAEQLTQFTTLLEQAIQAQGFNVGLNLGQVAGAGVPGHLHWHIVPRWGGDTNFMPVVGAIDVIPQSLEALWEALRDELDK